jgi:diacylglycerol kinase family enzyme
MPPHVTAILNFSAGPAENEDIHRRVKAFMQARGLDWNIWVARSGAEVSALARQAAAGESSIVVAGGGDGTLSAIASALVGTNKILGVLPLGTLNHFAKDLEIPLDVEPAIETVATGQPVAVDVGEVNGRFFLNNSSLGIYPKIVDRRDAQRKYGKRKWAAFFSAALAALQRYPVLRVRLSGDGRQLNRKTPVVFIGNNHYQIQGLNLGARKCLNGGRLCLYMLHDTGRWGLLKLAVKALLGAASSKEPFDALSATEFAVDTQRRRVRVALDGETATIETPLTYRVHAGALRVIVPAPKPIMTEETPVAYVGPPV